MIKIWCEWDIGHDGIVFKTKADARKWIESNHVLKDIMCEDQVTGYQSYFDHGLIGYESVTVK